MGLRVAELFAGVGGFRLGLQAAGHEVVWSNQWEPGKKQQWASDCYVRHFGREGHSNGDIAKVRKRTIPDHDLLVGGFPCQDYSVATTLDKSGGIQGKKGVLWWEIVRTIRAKRPPYLLLENVDRLLKSPAKQRGRDFAILLSSLANRGYCAEWRVVNAADYGFPQRRRRVFIFAARNDMPAAVQMKGEARRGDHLTKTGFFARAFPVRKESVSLATERDADWKLDRRLTVLSRSKSAFHFQNAGVMAGHAVWTHKVLPAGEDIVPLSSVLQPHPPAECFVPEELLPRWKYMKGAKKEERTARNGYVYEYTEGAIAFPDLLDQPARTLLTSEGGTSPSRIKHILKDPATGQLRTLTPVECELLNGFPKDWTAGMPANWRYFTMGNALVVGLIERMAHQLPTVAHMPEANERSIVVIPEAG